MQTSNARRIPYLLTAVILLLGFAALSLRSAQLKSPVLNEPYVLARGLTFWSGENLALDNNLSLQAVVSGVGAVLEPGVSAPDDLSSASITGWLWSSGLNVGRVIFVVRLASIWVALLLGSLIWQWAFRSYGKRAAVIALFLYAFSPTILAYSHFASGDLLAAAFFVVTICAWMRFYLQSRWLWLVVSILTGILALGFSAYGMSLLPAGVVCALMMVRESRDSIARRLMLPAALLIGVGVSLAGALAVSAPALDGWSSGLPLALPALNFEPLPGDSLVFLFGRLYPENVWFWPIMLLLIRGWLPHLVLVGIAALVAGFRGPLFDDRVLANISLVYVIVLPFFEIPPDMGVLLPVLLLLMVFASRIGSVDAFFTGKARIFPVVFALVMLGGTLLNFPHFMSFTNIVPRFFIEGQGAVVGGQDDQGQDLPSLARYMQDRQISTVYLDYAGIGDPAYYGINYIPLSPVSASSRADVVDFAPLNPAAGVYAISASRLVTGVTGDVFLQQEPDAVLGNSIYIYDRSQRPVVTDGWLTQCRQDPVSGGIADMQSLVGFTPRLVDVDCENTLVLPPGNGWMVLPADISPLAELGRPDIVLRDAVEYAPRYHVWVSPVMPDLPVTTVEYPPVSLPLPVANQVELLGFTISSTELAPSQTAEVITWWRIRQAVENPLVFTLRLLAFGEDPVLRVDIGDLPGDAWQSGTVIAVRHVVVIPADAVPGSYIVSAELISLATGEALPVSEVSGRVVRNIVLRTVNVAGTP